MEVGSHGQHWKQRKKMTIWPNGVCWGRNPSPRIQHQPTSFFLVSKEPCPQALSPVCPDLKLQCSAKGRGQEPNFLRAVTTWCLPSSCCSVTQSSSALYDRMHYSTSGFPVLHHLPESAQTHAHWVGEAKQPSHPLLPPSHPALIFSRIRVFSNESALCIRWPKYWSFSSHPCMTTGKTTALTT